jgi:hypothetical protein
MFVLCAECSSHLQSTALQVGIQPFDGSVTSSVGVYRIKGDVSSKVTF